MQRSHVSEIVLSDIDYITYDDQGAKDDELALILQTSWTAPEENHLSRPSMHGQDRP